MSAAMPAITATACRRPRASFDAEQSPADLRKLVDNLLAATREMENRTKSLEKELQKSSDQVNELRSKLDNVRKESLTDPLTGIANRKAFDAAPWRKQRSRRSGRDAGLAADVRHRPFQEIQRQLGTSDRRPGIAAGGELPVGKCQRPRYRRPLWRRGIRGGAARHRPERRGACRRSDPPIGGGRAGW